MPGKKHVKGGKKGKKGGKRGNGNGGNKNVNESNERNGGLTSTLGNVRSNDKIANKEMDMDHASTASIDGTHDGIWLYDGNGMMIDFDDENFESDLKEDWEDELDELREEFGHDDLPRWEDEFVELDMKTIQAVCLSLKQRGLHLASGVLRRVVQAESSDYHVPSFVRITKLEDYEMKDLLSKKKKGNLLFSAKKYDQAAEMYDEALMDIMGTSLFVSPEEQVKEVINVLSNLSECYLRLEAYDDAAGRATDALVLDNDHAKSRIRRAKAELAIYQQQEQGSLPYLAQACHDLEEVLTGADDGPCGPDHTKIAIEVAQELLHETNLLLEIEREKMAEESPQTNFDLLVRIYKSKCW